MHHCKFCNNDYPTSHAKTSHETLCKLNPDRNDTTGVNNGMYGKKGSNQYANKDWDSVSFEDLGRGKQRERLLKEADHKCTRCGFNERRSCGGSILEIDHIDGNPSNNVKENLCVLCPNCHALTPTFRNWGNQGNVKTSPRVRKGNTLFQTII